MWKLNKPQPILVTGIHRGGTTWVGKMLAATRETYYLSEVFPLDSELLPSGLINYWYPYFTAESRQALIDPVNRVLSFNFAWPHRTRWFLPDRLIALRLTRRWLGLPRPIIRDPFTAMIADWLADTFQMNVLCLFRHPAAVVTSLQRVNWRFDFKNFLEQPRLMEKWLHPFAAQLIRPSDNFIENGALLWLCVYHVLASQLEHHPEWLVWRLEDIAAKPEDAFQTIYQRLGLAYTQRIRRRVWQYSNDSNPTQATDQDRHFIQRNSRAVQAMWRTALTADEIKRIRRIVEPVSSRYYSDADW